MIRMKREIKILIKQFSLCTKVVQFLLLYEITRMDITRQPMTAVFTIMAAFYLHQMHY